MARKGTTRNGWKVEDHADDYVLYSKEDGNLAIVIALETRGEEGKPVRGSGQGRRHDRGYRARVLGVGDGVDRRRRQ